MKITVLDGSTLSNNNDISWESLESLGSVTVYDKTDKEDVVKRAQGSDAVISNKIVFDEETLTSLPSLKYIGIMATGYNVVDLKTAGEKGITVTNVPSYSTDAVAEAVFSFILSYAHRPVEQSEEVKKGAWTSSPIFTHYSYPLFEIKGKTLGVFGMGNIGRRVGEIALCFGMRLIYTSREKKEDMEEKGARLVPFDTLLKESDFLTLHCPLTKETEKIINKESLGKMKKSAVLINASRGPVINEEDLYAALKEKTISFASLDVMETEPPPFSPLFSLNNIYVTPHTAWAPLETRKRLLGVVVDNLKAFMSGEKKNVVS